MTVNSHIFYCSSINGYLKKLTFEIGGQAKTRSSQPEPGWKEELGGFIAMPD
jgi:hypothetical protein